MFCLLMLIHYPLCRNMKYDYETILMWTMLIKKRMQNVAKLLRLSIDNVSIIFKKSATARFCSNIIKNDLALDTMATLVKQ